MQLLVRVHWTGWHVALEGNLFYLWLKNILCKCFRIVSNCSFLDFTVLWLWYLLHLHVHLLNTFSNACTFDFSSKDCKCSLYIFLDWFIKLIYSTLQCFSGRWTTEQRCQKQNSTLFTQSVNWITEGFYLNFGVFSLSPYTVPYGT